MSPRWKLDESRKFVNPYHFVRLDKAGCARQKRSAGEDLSKLRTGWVDCILTTLTPLFIPNSSNNDVLGEREGNDQSKRIKSYDFYSYTDLSAHSSGEIPSPTIPVIPGSELRGAIRSAFEAVTRSCMLSDNHETLYKRTTKAGNPGLLRKNSRGNWEIVPCRRFGVAKWPAGKDKGNFSVEISKLKDGDRVWITNGGEYTKPMKDGRPPLTIFPFVGSIEQVRADRSKPEDAFDGVFHLGEPYNNKHHESVFVRKDDSRPFEIDEGDVERLKVSLVLYRDSSINHNKLKHTHEGYPQYEIRDSGETPVYWSRAAGTDEPVYLSPSAVGREVFGKTIKSILDKQGGYGACTDAANACPACQLFGMVQGGQSIAGRVRFEDAQLTDPPIDLSTLYRLFVCLPELASPKISATEFYVSRPSPQARLWNYDYYTLDGREGKPYMPELRGRKFYWHQSASVVEGRLFDTSTAVSATKGNVFVRPLRTGLTFRFRVHFDRVSTEELDRLLWVLSIDGRSTGLENSPYGLKMGMGKPVGLGSVSVCPTAVTFRRVVMDGDIGTIKYEIVRSDWQSSFGDTKEQERLLGASRETVGDFLEITNFKKDRANVEYPRNNSSTRRESYHWFVANKITRSDSSPMNPAVNQVLPSIEHPELSSYKEEDTGASSR